MKAPEAPGGAPLPLFRALVGRTWYQGGGMLTAFVAEQDREVFRQAAIEAGYTVACVSPFAFGAETRLRFELARR